MIRKTIIVALAVGAIGVALIATVSFWGLFRCSAGRSPQRVHLAVDRGLFSAGYQARVDPSDIEGTGKHRRWSIFGLETESYSFPDMASGRIHCKKVSVSGPYWLLFCALVAYPTLVVIRGRLRHLVAGSQGTADAQFQICRPVSRSVLVLIVLAGFVSALLGLMSPWMDSQFQVWGGMVTALMFRDGDAQLYIEDTGHFPRLASLRYS